MGAKHVLIIFISYIGMFFGRSYMLYFSPCLTLNAWKVLPDGFAAHSLWSYTSYSMSLGLNFLNYKMERIDLPSKVQCLGYTTCSMYSFKQPPMHQATHSVLEYMNKTQSSLPSRARNDDSCTWLFLYLFLESMLWNGKNKL